jgi:tRNA A-37 threonylcarbamoyl transferase component Bud32
MIGSDNPTPGTFGTRRRRLGNYHWIVREEFVDDELLGRFAQPAGLLAAPTEVLKPELTGKTTVALIRSSRPGVPAFVAKRYRSTGFWQRFKDSLRRSRGIRSFELALRLGEIQVPTAVPVAAGERRVAGCLMESWLVTLYVQGARTLAQCLKSEEALSRVTVRQLADVLARLHEGGFCHRDLKATNVLLDDQLRPWLIDLDGVRRFRRLSDYRAVIDLARLAREFANSPTLLRWSGRRFLLRYCASRNRPAAFRRLDAKLRCKL